MPKHPLDLTPRQRDVLALVASDTAHVVAENAKKKRRKDLKPAGYIGRGERTLFGLEKRDLVRKLPPPEGETLPLWKVTTQGKEALDRASL